MSASKKHTGGKLLIVGSIAFDTVRTPAGSARRVIGGSAVYCSAAARNVATMFFGVSPIHIDSASA